MVVLMALAGSCFANPSLTPGVWKNISPPTLDLSAAHFGSAVVQIDPGNPSTLYLSVDMQGLWKTADGGSTWSRLGDTTATYNYGTTTKYLDSPIMSVVDPGNPNHLYATQGVRGATMGFWESTDGGATWSMPAGFVAVSSTIGTRDMTTMSVDPVDFKHILVGSHSPWTGYANAGILETTDGGATFAAHPPVPGWPSGSMAINFLYFPKQNLGNKNTWLVGLDGAGIFRTTDAGTSWAKVSDKGIPHGGGSLYCTAAGVLYTGGPSYPQRSADHGDSWQEVKNGLGNWTFYTVQGDGTNLYTTRSFAGNDVKYNVPFYVSSETDGTNWTAYDPLGAGAQTFDNGPFTLRFDNINRIMYSANWCAGLWALKVIDPGTSAARPGAALTSEATARVPSVTMTKTEVVIRDAAGHAFDANGESQ